MLIKFCDDDEESVKNGLDIELVCKVYACLNYLFDRNGIG